MGHVSWNILKIIEPVLTKVTIELEVLLAADYNNVTSKGCSVEIEAFKKKCISLSTQYFNEGNYKKSLPYFKILCSLEKRNERCWNNLGIALYELGHFEAACARFEAAVKLNNKFLYALGNLSFALMRMGRYSESMDYARKVLAREPENQLANRSLAFCHTALGETEDSERIISKLDTVDGENLSIASLLRALNQSCRNKHHEALWELSVCAERWPQSDLARQAFLKCFAHFSKTSEPEVIDELIESVNLSPPAVKDVAVDITTSVPPDNCIDIVIPIFNSLDDLKDCLGSIRKHQTSALGYIILVDDRSDFACTSWIEQYASAHPDVLLSRNTENRGFAFTVQKGVSLSSAEFVVMLNSDTTVGKGWLEGLWRAITSRSDAAAAGPWSNQAYFQTLKFSGVARSNLSASEVTDKRNSFLHTFQFDTNKYPVFPLLSGFCLMMRTSVFRDIGEFDLESFPRGYWESQDFCLRLIDSEMVSVLATDVFIYHSAGKSISEEQRDALTKGGVINLYKKHSAFRVLCAEALCAAEAEKFRVLFDRISPGIITQIMAQSRHDMAVLAPGALALPNLRRINAPDLLQRDGIDVPMAFAHVRSQPGAVFIIPFLVMGGAEKYAADLVDVLRMKSVGPVLVIVTDQTEEEAFGWQKFEILSPLQQSNIIFWRDICSSFKWEDPSALSRFINALQPRLVVIVNSHLGLETVAKFGRGLSQFARLYCAFFSMGINGLGGPHGAYFPRRIMPFALALTDNQPMEETLRRLHGEIPGPGIATLPPRIRIISDELSASRLSARQERTLKGRERRWLWVSRIEPFKGTALLADLAKFRPADQFEVFGAVDGELVPTELILKNINVRPALQDVIMADFTQFDGFIFTSLFEGMPNTVLEMSQHLIPMVLADVGGLRRTFDDDAALFVPHGADTKESAAAFSLALDRIIGMDSVAIVRMVAAAQRQMLAKHSSAAHANTAATIFGIE